jgi:hypothetical protein
MPTDSPDSPYAYFEIDQDLTYDPFFDDFGPMNLLMIHRFKHKLSTIIYSNAHRSTAMWVGRSPEARTNAALFLGSYMVMSLDFSPTTAEQRLAPLCAIAFRDVLPPLSPAECVRRRTQSKLSVQGTSTYAGGFKLSVRDCLEALQRAKELRWLRLSESEANDDPCSGAFDPEEFEFLDNPLNADLHEVGRGPEPNEGRFTNLLYTCEIRYRLFLENCS